ncbi:unnamed protein product [Cuscuta campestris]|uniref:DUF1985 domain-containing protein n=1 Tax=Cuscuta campestris TaxID=132261 RepID=A0A484LRM8_9ASTE|nr:unnamed protein product [Cuscuta campestris]
MTTRSSTAKKMANRERVDDDDDFVDKIPIIKTMHLVKTTSGRVYKRLCDEEVLVGKAGLKVTCFCNVWVGAKSIRDAVSASEMAELKESAFGFFFKLGGIKWVNGQLLILLTLNHVEPINRCGDVDRIKFHIGDRIVEFKKSDFALITGLKFGKEAEYGDTDLEKANDISTRYFNGKMSVTRIQVENVFNSIKNSRGRERLDAVKLALLNFLMNHVVGNQGLTKIPALYMHLVDDLRRFNGFQWGEHLWNDMVESLRKCSSILNTGEHCRFTFLGFLFPLQIWTFETFPSLRENGICIVGQKRSSLTPRALRWETGKRPMHDLLEGSIFGTEEKVFNGQRWLLRQRRKGKKRLQCYSLREMQVKLILTMVEESTLMKGKEKGKVVIRKKTKGQKTDKKSDGSRGGTSRGAPQGRQSDLGEGRENEPSLRDIMTAIVVMEKRNMKMRIEVTKLRIALNAQSRVLNRFISMNRMGKRWRKGKKRTTEDNAMPSFDLGFESEEKKDATEPDVDDDVWDEVEGRWVKAVDTLGLGKRPERNVENEDCGKGPTHMVEVDMLLGDVGTAIGVEDVLRTGVYQTKAASQVNGDMSAMNMSGQGNEIKEDVAGFTGKFETASQVIQGQVLRTGNGIDLLRAVYEEVQDPEDDAEVVVEEPSTQIVVYEAPIASETPPEWRAKEKRPLKCPDRFTPDDLAVQRKRKRVRTEGVRVTHFRGDEDEFMGPFPLDPKGMPAEEALMKVETFMYQGLLKNHLRVSGRKYRAPDDVLDPSLYKGHYDEEETLTKTWYYNIFFPWGWLSDKHLDVIFYYLRMKGVEFGMEQRYTTTDTPFLALMKTLCAMYMNKELTIEQATRNKSSCGMFVVKMAEFLMMGCDVGDMDDHEIAAYRKKMTVELFAYSAM